MNQYDRDDALVMVGARIEAGDRDRLKELAKAEDRSLSNYVRGVLRRHLADAEAPRHGASPTG